MKKAFSLIEVIFVLVILGIVASISSQIIVQVYESYITQQAVYKVGTKTELAINQIVNRLTYSVIDSAIAKDATDSTNYKLLTDLDLTTDTNLTILEWIGYDNDSFSAGLTPYWSGVANYETATKSMFDTPASDLTKVDTIIKKLSHNEVGLNGSAQQPAVIFQPRTGEGDTINGECMGLVKNDTSCIYSVSENNSTRFSFEDINKSKIITERYQLAWSAYALVPTLKSNGLYDLNLHYNYQPWEGEEYNSNSTSTRTLITNVSVFKFTQSGGVIQLKLCATENIGRDSNISTCKEKAIIR
jgi:prepilin-type N-terminal cleavage/methylation domain-containing protein